MRLPVALGAVLVAVAAAAACGGEDETTLRVFAAASLTDVFPRIDGEAAYTFAGSNTLLQQLRQGAPADVLAAASPREPRAAHEEGLCGEPVAFATNELVAVVPAGNPAGIDGVRDLGRPGVRVVLAAEGVPVGDYARGALDRLGVGDAVLANVVSNEPDARSVVGKVALGEADAGIAYRTDVAPSSSEVAAIAFPAGSQPGVRYALCVTTRAGDPAAAAAFVERVLGPAGQAELADAGFGPPEGR